MRIFPSIHELECPIVVFWALCLAFSTGRRKKDVEIPEVYQILVTCRDEEEQYAVFNNVTVFIVLSFYA